MEAEGIVYLLSSLGQHTRLAIYQTLVRAGERGMAAGRIGETLGLPPATLSFHLKELASTGLILARGRGRFIIYAVNPRQMTELLRWLIRNGCRGFSLEQIEELRAGLAALPAARRKR